MSITWIEAEIRRHYPVIVQNGATAVDLNRNQQVDAGESVSDAQGNGLDLQDWNRFYLSHLSTFTAAIAPSPLLRYGGSLSPFNIIHEVLHVESIKNEATLIAETYQVIQEILAELRAAVRTDMTPRQKMGLLLRILDRRFEGVPEESSLVQAVHHRRLDCDTSVFLALAIAHEMSWPVYAVRAPNHFFLRWQDNTTRLNFDFNIRLECTGTEPIPDEFYIRSLNLSPSTIQRGVYLRNLSREEIIAAAYLNLSFQYNEEGQPREELRAIYNALSRDHGFAISLPEAVWHYNFDRYESALSSFKERLREDPGNLYVLWYIVSSILKIEESNVQNGHPVNPARLQEAISYANAAFQRIQTMPGPSDVRFTLSSGATVVRRVQMNYDWLMLPLQNPQAGPLYDFYLLRSQAYRMLGNTDLESADLTAAHYLAWLSSNPHGFRLGDFSRRLEWDGMREFLRETQGSSECRLEEPLRTEYGPLPRGLGFGLNLYYNSCLAQPYE